MALCAVVNATTSPCHSEVKTLLVKRRRARGPDNTRVKNNDPRPGRTRQYR